MSLRRHALLNLAGAVLPIAVSLLTIPLYLQRIGEARYGVLAMVWLLLGYFGLFDLGLGRATAQRVAALAQAPARARADSLWTALIVNLALGLAGGVILWPVADYSFAHLFPLAPALRGELAAALPWLALAVPVATVSGVLSGALEGRQRFLEINLVSVTGAILTQCLPLAVAVIHGPDLGWLIPAVVLSRSFSVAALYWRCHVHVLQGHAASLARGEIKPLLQFGGWVTVSSLVGPLMVVLDRFVIGAQLGAQAVTHYTVPFQLAGASAILPGALTTAMFPRLAGHSAEQAEALAGVALRTLAVAFTPIMLIGVLLMEPFLRVWLGADLAQHGAATGAILLLGFWINAFARVPFAQLQARGRPDRVALGHVLELLPYFALLYLGLRYAGLPGAALAFSLRTLADWALLAWWAGSLSKAARLLAPPAAVLLAALALVLQTSLFSPLRWGPALVLLAVCAVWSWRAAPDELRRYAGLQARMG